jgi:hypothetical protein
MAGPGSTTTMRVRVRRATVRGHGRLATLTGEIDCGQPCSVRASAAVRRGRHTLSRVSGARRRTKRKTAVRLRIRLSGAAQRALRHRRAGVYLKVEATAGSARGTREQKIPVRFS